MMNRNGIYDHKLSFIFQFIIFTFFVMVSGCAIYYKDLSHLDQNKFFESKIEKIQFRSKNLPLFASESSEAIRDAFRDSQKFQVAEEYFDEQIPIKGVYIFVEPTYKVPSIGALAFGYLSVATLTVLPAWSNEDGFIINYRVYKNGELIKTFQYKRERFLALWIGILPFSWVNFFTNDEYDAFYSATNEFLHDFQQLENGLYH